MAPRQCILLLVALTILGVCTSTEDRRRKTTEESKMPRRCGNSSQTEDHLYFCYFCGRETGIYSVFAECCQGNEEIVSFCEDWLRPWPSEKNSSKSGNITQNNDILRVEGEEMVETKPYRCKNYFVISGVQVAFPT